MNKEAKRQLLLAVFFLSFGIINLYNYTQTVQLLGIFQTGIGTNSLVQFIFYYISGLSQKNKGEKK